MTDNRPASIAVALISYTTEEEDILDGTWIRPSDGNCSVVFVHGIFSAADTCWGNNPSWPILLASESDLRTVGIYTFTYYTDIFSGHFSANDVVTTLYQQLRLDHVIESRRLIFVCHSMGGLIARKFVVDRVVELKARETKVGFFLVASPSLGADYADWLSFLAKALGHKQADILRFVRNNDWLSDLNTRFINLRESGELDIRGKELVEDKFVLVRKLWRRQVVEPFAGAIFFGDAVKIPRSDHFTICKPQNSKALQHRLLCEFIRELNQISAPSSEDKRAITFFQMCFDRPAFKTPFNKESSEEDFRKAMEDTIVALNTGNQLHREDRTVLNKGLPRNRIQNEEWRLTMDNIEELLQRILQTYRSAAEHGLLSDYPYNFLRPPDPAVGQEIDRLRIEALGHLNRVCVQAGVPTVKLVGAYPQ